MNKQKLKLSILGSSQTGKTSFLKRFVNNSFTESYNPTIGVYCTNKNVTKSETEALILNIWDSGGDFDWKRYDLSYCKFPIGFLIVFSVSDRNSFQNIKSYWNYIENSGVQNHAAILIGSKCDLEDERQVSYDDAKQFADECEIFYAEVSAKTGYNVNLVTQLLYEGIYKFLL